MSGDPEGTAIAPSPGAERQWIQWQTGHLPLTEEVADGIWSIPIPMPNYAVSYSLVYVLLSQGEVVLVDAGWPSEQAWSALVNGLEQAGLRAADVSGVVVTHAHRDHYGLVPRLRDDSDAWVAMSPSDALGLHMLRERPFDLAERYVQQMLGCAMTTAQVEEWRRTWLEGIADLRIPQPTRLIRDGDRISVGDVELEVIATPGHTTGHLCLLEPDDGLLFSGDHVLPKTRTNVSSFGSGGEDLLGAHRASLERVRAREVRTVFPAHEYRFSDVAVRLTQLSTHHARRAQQVLETIRRQPALTTHDVATRLPWSRPFESFSAYPLRAAIGETQAHLVALADVGELVADGGRPARWYTTDQLEAELLAPEA